MQEPCTKDIIDWLVEYRYQLMTWCASSKRGPSCYASSSARTGVRVPPPPARDALLPPRRGKPRSHATRSSATSNEKSPDRLAGARILNGNPEKRWSTPDTQALTLAGCLCPPSNMPAISRYYFPSEANSPLISKYLRVSGYY